MKRSVFLCKFWLLLLPAEKLDKARVLGLQNFVDNGTLKWKRGDIVPNSVDRVSRCEHFFYLRYLGSSLPRCWMAAQSNQLLKAS